LEFRPTRPFRLLPLETCPLLLAIRAHADRPGLDVWNFVISPAAGVPPLVT
jgi:hypothetical protein